jgi:hypothetical protein
MKTLRGKSTTVATLLAWLLPLGVAAQKTPIGLEFQVNAVTAGAQFFPAVASDADGDFVVAWDIAGQDGYSYGIFARRFSSMGTPLGVEFQVNAYTSQGQRFPAIVAEPDGDFVVAWRSGSLISYDIFGRRFSSAGAPLTGDFLVNTHTTGQQLNPVAAINASGDFVLAWFSYQDGAGTGIFARRFSSAGAAVGGEFQVNAHTVQYQANPTAALGSSGAFVIAWQSNLQDGQSWGVFGRRFSSAGSTVAGEFQVNTHTLNYQGNPTAAVGPNGDFVIAWESRDQDGYGYGLFGRRFSSGGAFLATEFRINDRTAGSERLPFATADAAGNFVVTWHDDSAAVKEVFARRFPSTGAPLTSQFQVNTETLSYQNRAAAAAESDGDFVIVWMSNHQDGSSYGIFGQRFAATTTLDVDGNGVLDALTDGLLVLRFAFGFTGAALSNGAVGGGCTRCAGPAIATYLTGLGALLNIDGNPGPPDALTDGLLLLRYLFGFRGSALITNATGAGCTRCDAPMIEGYLAGITD